MKIYYYFVFFAIVISCSKSRNTEYEDILSSLEKNYTVECNSKSPFLFCWKVNKKTFIKDSIDYKIGLEKFYSQDSDFLKYLLKNKLEGINQWIKTKNLCDATVSKEDFVSNEYAVKILIDNLITNNNTDTIIINKYVDNLELKKIEQIIFDDDNVKDKYKEYIKTK
jgi:hypothetical protein